MAAGQRQERQQAKRQARLAERERRVVQQTLDLQLERERLVATATCNLHLDTVGLSVESGVAPQDSETQTFGLAGPHHHKRSRGALEETQEAGRGKRAEGEKKEKEDKEDNDEDIDEAEEEEEEDRDEWKKGHTGYEDERAEEEEEEEEEKAMRLFIRAVRCFGREECVEGKTGRGKRLLTCVCLSPILLPHTQKHTHMQTQTQRQTHTLSLSLSLSLSLTHTHTHRQTHSHIEAAAGAHKQTIHRSPLSMSST